MALLVLSNLPSARQICESTAKHTHRLISAVIGDAVFAYLEYLESARMIRVARVGITLRRRHCRRCLADRIASHAS